MIKVSIGDEVIGHVESFAGNKQVERWVAFRPREEGDNGAYPRRQGRFPTRKAAVQWLEDQHNGVKYVSQTNEPARDHLKERLWQIFHESGRSLADIATQSGLTPLAVRRVLHEQEPSTLYKMSKVAEALGYKIDLVKKD